MFDPVMQLDYLRDVQQTFAHGSGRYDLFEVFFTILKYVVPAVTIVAAWRYRSYLQYLFMAFVSRVVHGPRHTDIEKYLTVKGVMLEVHFLDPSGIGPMLCHARISSVLSGRLDMDLIQVRPTARNLKGQQVICLCKPFSYKGEKYNSFVSHIAYAGRKGGALRKLVLLAPVRYRFTIRRKHTRQRVTRQDMFRIKAWDGRKRSNFWQQRPDIQTLTQSTRNPHKMQLRVGNISPGGIRLFVDNPKQSELPPLKEGYTLVLRISIRQPKTKKFVYFTVLGTIRSRFRGKGGSVGLGIQFTAMAEKNAGEGSGYSWRTIKEEVGPLARLLADLRSSK